MGEVEHAREQQLKQRVDALQNYVDQLEQALADEGTNSIPLDRAVS